VLPTATCWLIALLVVLLNWINTTGEFILADFVQRDARVARGRERPASSTRARSSLPSTAASSSG